MVASLPNELTIEILSHALIVPDEIFAYQSVLAVIPPSSAPCLCTCRSWYRIGIPLFYNTVILRSSSQTEALAISIRGNKKLGRLIQKLRIEGGYGGVMYSFIKAAPNITDLCLSLSIRASDNVSGLCRALPMIKPCRLVLYDQDRLGLINKNIIALHETLTLCIRKWATLRALYFPYSEALGMSSSLSINALALAIKEAPNLEEITMPFAYSFPKHLHVMAENPSLRVIRVQRTHTHGGAIFSFEHGVQNDQRLKELVVYSETVT